MPIYEYQCDACGERHEAMQKISDRPLKTCPSCNAKKLRRVVSPTVFRLKGSGWYETDFKKGAKKHIAAGGDDAEKGKEKKDGKDAKPAEKPAAKESADKPATKAEEKPAKGKSGKPAVE